MTENRGKGGGGCLLLLPEKNGKRKENDLGEALVGSEEDCLLNGVSHTLEKGSHFTKGKMKEEGKENKHFPGFFFCQEITISARGKPTLKGKKRGKTFV